MRKLFLSGLVIFSFLVWSLHQRFEKPDIPVTAPMSLVSTQSSLPELRSSPVPSGLQSQTQLQTQASPVPTGMGQNMMMRGKYKDGTYTGNVADAYYGNLQVQVVISGGRLTDVVFLDYPQDRSTSREINSQAMPYLKAEAIAAQSASVDGVSGASQSSAAFIESLQSALAKAS